MPHKQHRAGNDWVITRFQSVECILYDIQFTGDFENSTHQINSQKDEQVNDVPVVQRPSQDTETERTDKLPTRDTKCTNRID